MGSLNCVVQKCRGLKCGLQKYVVFTIGLKIMGSLKSGPQKYGVLKLWASKIRGPHNVGS